MPDFSTSLLGLTFVSGLATAFIDQDRRVLSFFTEPEAFFVEETAAPVPMSFPVEWGQSPRTLSQAPTTRRSQERSRSRTPVQQVAQAPQPFVSSPFATRSTPAPNSAPPAAATSASPVQAAGVSSAAQAAPVTAAGARSTAPSVEPVPNGLTLGPVDSFPLGSGLTGGNLVRVGTDPDAGPTVETTTVDPVVPAVPEPSSWILMILGVGLLGIMFRYRREDDDEDMVIFADNYRTA